MYGEICNKHKRYKMIRRPTAKNCVQCWKQYLESRLCLDWDRTDPDIAKKILTDTAIDVVNALNSVYLSAKYKLSL